MINLNYDELSNATHTVSTTPYVYDADGVDITDEITNLETPEFVSLRESPSTSSGVKANIPNDTSVTMLREWVTGNKDWAFVKYNDEKGYILTQHLALLSGKILPKAEISLKTLNKLEEALAPSTTWMNNSTPYYHSGNGEWWFTVTLPHTCIDAGTLEQKKDEAKTEAIAYMYEYFDLNISGEIYTQQEFKEGLQSCYVKEYYLDTRPESQLMMLVTIPDIYIEWLKIHNVPTEISPDELDNNYCISIPANSTEDLSAVRDDIKDCLVNLYKKYLESNIKVTNFDFINEIAKQDAGISQIKVLLELNNIDLGSASNQAASEDPCTASPKYKKIEICFSNDGNYNLLAVYYYNNSGEKTTLSTGLNSIKNSYPFNEPRFGHLFLNHQKLCSLPEPVLTQFFDEYCVDPVPSVEIVPIEEKPIISPALQEQLGIAINTALFLGSMAQQFGLILDKDGENSLGFNCYSSSKSLEAFKLKSMELRNSQFMYGADVANFINFVCELIDKPNEEIEEEGGSVPPGGLPGLPGPPDFDAGDWGWAWLFAIVGDAGSWKDLWNISFKDWSMPTFNLMEGVEEAGKNIVKEAKDSMIYSLVKVFLQLNCQALIAGAATLGAIGVAAYLISQVDDDDDDEEDDDETLAEKKSYGLNPSPADLLAKDYGAENCNAIIQESIKVSPENYDKYIVEKFLRCGVYIPSDMTTLPRQYLDGVSSIISPVEMLALLKGSSSIAVLHSIVKYTQNQFPTIFASLNTQSKVSNFFVCLGEETTPQTITKVEEKIKEKALDSDYCLNVAEKLKDIMKNKCPSPEAYDAIYEKEFGSNVEMYQELITLIDDQCSNVNLKLYNNPETGEKGLLNSLNGKLKGEEKVNNSIAESLLEPAKFTATIESQMINNNYSDVFISYNNNPYLQTLVSDFITAFPIESEPDPGIGTKVGYRYNSNFVTSEYESAIPLYRLKQDGNNYIYDYVSEKYYYIPNPEMSENIQLIANNNPNDEDLIESSLNLKLSENQRIFYGLVDDYFIKNSKTEFGTSVVIPPAPYGIHPFLLQKKEDIIFSNIFKTLIGRYAKIVSSAWGGDQEESYKAYLETISLNIENILNYDQAKKECYKYFDVAEYDNPNDNSKIGPKQYSLLNGLLYTYVRFHTLEYFVASFPFYEVFSQFSEENVLKSELLDTEFVKSHIKKKINDNLESSLTNSSYYKGLINETYDYVKKRSSYQLKEYSGDSRGLDYYFESAYNDFIQAFSSALDKVPSQYKKQKIDLEEGNFIYSKSKIFPTHDYAGLHGLFDEEFTNYPSLSGKSCKTDYTDRDCSLFQSDRYEKFKDGIFFIQNYFYISDKENPSNEISVLSERRNHLRGVLSPDNIVELGNYISNNQSSLMYKKLKELFGSVKFGSRLCYGLAHDIATSNTEAKTIAKEIAQMYQKKDYDGPAGNNGYLNDGNDANIYEYYFETSKSNMSLQKAIVCVDGNDIKFIKKISYKDPQGEDVIVDEGQYIWVVDYDGTDGDTTVWYGITDKGWETLSSGETFTTGDLGLNLQDGYSGNQSLIYGAEKQYSLVVPIFNIESEADLDQSFSDFYGNFIQNNFDPQFQNLNGELINGDEYKALLKNCFSPENMVHFNAFSIARTNGLLNKDFFIQTKQLLISSMQGIANAKNIT